MLNVEKLGAVFRRESRKILEDRTRHCNELILNAMGETCAEQRRKDERQRVFLQRRLVGEAMMKHYLPKSVGDQTHKMQFFQMQACTNESYHQLEINHLLEFSYSEQNRVF